LMITEMSLCSFDNII